MIIASWALAFGVLIFMSCSTRARRKFPINYIFLVVFTLVFSVMTAAITANYDVQAVGIALAVTAATVGGAFFVARFTKLDLTKYGGFLVAILIGVIVMSIIAIFWRNKCGLHPGMSAMQVLHMQMTLRMPCCMRFRRCFAATVVPVRVR